MISWHAYPFRGIMVARERLGCLRENVLRRVHVLCFRENLDVLCRTLLRIVCRSRGSEVILRGFYGETDSRGL